MMDGVVMGTPGRSPSRSALPGLSFGIKLFDVTL